MHPIEAVSILSQLAYIPPAIAEHFSDVYALRYGYTGIPVHAPIPEYVPLFTEFTYASTLYLDPETPNQYSTPGPRLESFYDPSRVGKASRYKHTLFLMTRDLSVLEARTKTDPYAGYYCVRNEDPIKSNLSKSDFKEEYNVHVVYSCTGIEHDAHVPKCHCPASSLPAEFINLAQRIAELKEAAPFNVRLKELHETAAAAHKAAADLERYYFPTSALLANYSFESWADIGASTHGMELRGIKSVSQYKADWLVHQDSTNLQIARVAAINADQELEAYIKAKEDAAFKLFLPEVRLILTTTRTNRNDGYSVPYYPLRVDDLTYGIYGGTDDGPTMMDDETVDDDDYFRVYRETL